MKRIPVYRDEIKGAFPVEAAAVFEAYQPGDTVYKVLTAHLRFELDRNGETTRVYDEQELQQSFRQLILKHVNENARSCVYPVGDFYTYLAWLGWKSEKVVPVIQFLRDSKDCPDSLLAGLREAVKIIYEQRFGYV